MALIMATESVIFCIHPDPANRIKHNNESIVNGEVLLRAAAINRLAVAANNYKINKQFFMLQLVRLFKTFGCWCLLSSIVLLACENNGRQNQVQPVENQTTRDASSLEPEDVTVEVSAGADTTIRSNALLNDFIPQWTVEEVLKRIPEAEVSKREPVPNRHVEGQIDTLVTIKSDSTIFQFYSQPGNDMLQSATLNKGGIALGKGLEIGMLAEEVARLLPPLQHKKSIPQSILIRSEQTPSSLRLRFEKNRLAYINYDGYVD